MASGMDSATLVLGAAGFIGSHLTDRLLASGERVIGVDNLSRGTRKNIEHLTGNQRFEFYEADLANREALPGILAKMPVRTVWHMAANSDIPAGIADPNVDLRDTFQTTFHALGAMRTAGVLRIAFASSSAVYGAHEQILTEDTGPLFPISNYGAMKLASEAIISAAAESFLERAWIFRFPNVIGPRATHGIIYDLLRKLQITDNELEVLGDGSQQKPYLHVSELVDAMMLIRAKSDARLNCYNIGPADEGTTVRKIAETVLQHTSPGTPIRYTGGRRGWVGDVPRFRYSIEKLRALGWSPRMSSQAAVELAVEEIHREFYPETVGV